MSLDESLSKLIQDDSPTATDVAMALLDKDRAIMTSNIRNVKVLNAMKMYITHYGNPDANTKSYSPKSALVMKCLYDSIILHKIAHKGWRAEQIVKIFTGLQAFLSMSPQQEQSTTGLLGKKR